MDLAGGLRRFRALANRPRAALVRAGGQEGNQPEQIITFGDQAIQTALADAHFLEEHVLFLVVHLRDVLFDLRGDDQHLGVLARGDGLHIRHAGEAVLVLAEVVFLDVASVDHRLGGQQEPLAGNLALLVRHRAGARGLEIIQMRQQLFAQRGLIGKALFAALEHLCRALGALGDRLAVGGDQFEVDRLDVVLRVQAVRVANDIRILKAANNVHNRLALADVGEELVAQALTVARALDQTGDIDKLDDGRGRLLRVIHGGKLIQPLIRHGDNAGVRLDGAERVIRRFRARLGDRVKQSGFADVRQTDNA